MIIPSPLPPSIPHKTDIHLLTGASLSRFQVIMSYSRSDLLSERFMTNPAAQRVFAAEFRRRAECHTGTEFSLHKACTQPNIDNWAQRIRVLLNPPNWL